MSKQPNCNLYTPHMIIQSDASKKGEKLEEGGPPVNHLDTNLLELQAEHYLPSSHLGPMSKRRLFSYS